MIVICSTTKIHTQIVNSVTLSHFCPSPNLVRHTFLQWSFENDIFHSCVLGMLSAKQQDNVIFV